MLRCAQVEQEKRRSAAAAAAEKRAQAASTWWGWATGAGKAKSPEDAANQQDDMRANLTADEYSKLEDMVSEQEQAVKTGGPHTNCSGNLTMLHEHHSIKAHNVTTSVS